MIKGKQLELSNQAFWDIDMNSLNGNEMIYADWIIKRVAQYGTFEDIVNLADYYGEKRLLEAYQKMTDSEKDRSRLFEMFYIL